MPAFKRPSAENLAPSNQSTPRDGPSKKVAKPASVTFSGITPQPPRVIGYRRTNSGVDIAFRVAGKLFQAHSKVVAQHCTLFEKMVANGNYSIAKPIELPTPSAACFELLLEYLYVGTIQVAESAVLDFLETVHHVKCLPALNNAVAVVRKRLTSANCLEMLALASRLSLADLHKAAEALVAPNFEQVRRHPGFVTLPIASVKSLLADDALAITKEESAFEAACTWLSAQKRVVTPEETLSLLEHCRFPTMPRQYLTKEVLAHPLVRALPDGAARELILKAFLDAHYGPATSKRCVRRFSVPPLPGHAASSGSFHVGAEPAAGGAGGSASRSRSRSRSPTKGRRKSMRRASNDPPAELS